MILTIVLSLILQTSSPAPDAAKDLSQYQGLSCVFTKRDDKSQPAKFSSFDLTYAKRDGGDRKASDPDNVFPEWETASIVVEGNALRLEQTINGRYSSLYTKPSGLMKDGDLALISEGVDRKSADYKYLGRCTRVDSVADIMTKRDGE